jgi:protein-S-isoprenylcysteine O-methyltransferase Ste14
MSAETPFRLAIVLLIASAMSVAAYHRIRAHSGEKFDRREEGLALAIVLRLAGLAMWMGLFAYLINPEWMAWAALPLADWLRWIGGALGAAGAGLMYWTLASLGKNLTDTVATRRDATLVTHGPYRYVRHPFYVTVGLLMLGMALLTANLAIGISALAVMALLALRTPKEERKLLDKFGEPYRAYRDATGAFLPKWPT